MEGLVVCPICGHRIVKYSKKVPFGNVEIDVHEGCAKKVLGVPRRRKRSAAPVEAEDSAPD